MKSTFLLVLLLALAPIVVLAEDDLEKAKATDTEHLKKIGAALAAYQKAKGDYPVFLHELIPDFLPDPSVLVSPRGPGSDPLATHGDYDPKYPCSYAYEFRDAPRERESYTCRTFSTMALEECGPAIPLLRCLVYGNSHVINLNVAGDLFESTYWWWSDYKIMDPLYKKHGRGPGLTTGKMLTVTAVDAAGQPIPGIALTAVARKSDIPFEERDFTTDAQGRVTIPLGPDAAPYVRLRPKSDHWGAADRHWTFGQPGTPAEGEHAAITWPLSAAAPMSGLVLDAAGAPLAGAMVTALQLANPPKPDPCTYLTSTTTDARGHWTLPQMPVHGEDLMLMFYLEGYRSLTLQPSATTTPARAAFLDGTAEVRLLPPLLFQGRVTAAGRPVPGAKLYIIDPGSQAKTTNADGEFTYSVPVEGQYNLAVFAPDLAPITVTVSFQAGAAPAQIAMDPGHPLKGQLTDANNVPLAHVPLALMPSGIFLREETVVATTDEQGRFTWPHAPRAKVTLHPLSPDYPNTRLRWDATKDDPMMLHIDQTGNVR